MVSIWFSPELSRSTGLVVSSESRGSRFGPRAVAGNCPLSGIPVQRPAESAQQELKSMREFLDSKGRKVKLLGIGGRDAFEGLLEGNALMARKLRLTRARQSMKTPGNYVVGLDELEREIATLDFHTEIWPAREEWSARLVGCEDWGMKQFVSLHLTWYQGCEDPFARLSAYMSALDIETRGKQMPMELD
jgi:hypothetical protein